MNRRTIGRRDFHKLTTAALGGIAAGAILGCRGERPIAGPATGAAAASELHLCRGLNDCKGLGKSKDNACRGQGTCATVKEHSCGGQNECKGLGGCGETVGVNDCKTKGGCQVPLMTEPPGESAWDKLRKKKEAEWTEKKLESGPAPAKAE